MYTYIYIYVDMRVVHTCIAQEHLRLLRDGRAELGAAKAAALPAVM